MAIIKPQMFKKQNNKGLERIISKIIPKIKKAVTYTALTSLILFGSYRNAKADYDLEFYHSIGDDASVITPDSFNAIASTLPEVEFGKDNKDVKHSPAVPSRDYVQAFTNVSGTQITKDYQPLDSDLCNNSWQIYLNAFNNDFSGLSGTAAFSLVNSDSLNNLPSFSIAFVQRQDPLGTPIQNYNLKKTPNISWQVDNVQDIYAIMIPTVIDEYLRVAALCPEEPVINLNHFAVFARDWQKTGPLATDLNGDNVVDYEDLVILASNWLYAGE